MRKRLANILAWLAAGFLVLSLFVEGYSEKEIEAITAELLAAVRARKL